MLSTVPMYLLQNVKEAIREEINAIYLLVEGISLFDMLMSFATLASVSKGYSRPVFDGVRNVLSTTLLARGDPCENSLCLSACRPEILLFSVRHDIPSQNV